MNFTNQKPRTCEAIVVYGPPVLCADHCQSLKSYWWAPGGKKKMPYFALDHGHLGLTWPYYGLLLLRVSLYSGNILLISTFLLFGTGFNVR